MSLLMDALRRAEAEKKQAAKDKQNEPPQPRGAATAPEVSDDDLGATVKLDRLPLPISNGKDTGTAQPSSSLSVEDVASSASLDDLNVDFESTSPRVRINDSDHSDNNRDEQTHDFSINAEIPTERFKHELSLEPLQENADEDTEQTSPSLSENTAPGDIRSSQPEADSGVAASNVDPLLAASATESMLETSNGQTAVSANTIFEAGASGISRRLILWAIALGIAVIGLLGISGLYYFQQTPTTRVLPSPAASVELERARETEQTTNIAAITAKPPPQVSVSQPETIADDVSTQTDSSAVTGAQDRASDQGDGNISLPAKSSAENSSAHETNAGSQSNVTESQGEAGAQQSSAATDSPTVDTKRLTIAKSNRAEKSSQKVALAYEAYKAKNYEQARIFYEQALDIRPQDTNALNGLAALALLENDKETAHRLYSKVMKLDPRNATAKTAIFQIEGGVGNRVTESQLKLLLDEGGDPGAINFALGTLYARHLRWNDAQLAFFEAVRQRPNNPDYLYNLAVSLDQIGQHKAALNFYQQAIAASDDSSAGFNAALVLSRIQAISTQSASTTAP
ncbi:MAG: tetratricopeptide repeat protein [Gammaproteobacteria bacterium]